MLNLTKEELIINLRFWSEKKGELISKIRQDKNTALFVELWERMNDRF